MSVRDAEESESRDLKMPHCWLQRQRKGPRIRGRWRPLEAGKGKEEDSPLELLEEMQPC